MESTKTYSIDQVGGKAFNLLKLQEDGCAIPPFVVISQELMLRCISKVPSEDIIPSIEAVDISDDILAVVNKQINNAKDKLFAVRSSAVSEDGPKFSFAGQFESYLYVDYFDIPKYVKQVWKSNFSERIVAYRKNNNLEESNGIAVVIQEMIDPDVSGVAFGINPSTGAKGTKVINTVYGVGEGLVSGELNADNFLLENDKIQEVLTTKERKAVRSSSGSVAFVEVAEMDQKSSSLTEGQIRRVANELDRLEVIFGAPQDIEFAFKDEKFYLLQSRPITAVFSQEEKRHEKNRIIWDNSNIVESYPGVTTPLTFSYILNAYRQVYAQLAEIFGVSKKTITANDQTFSHMIGLVNGRVYYNLFSWYRMLALFPLYRLNARFMENMMGVKERFDLPKENRSSKLAATFRSVWMIVRILGHMFTIKRQTKQYLVDVERTLHEYKQLNLEEMSAFELMEKWKEIEAYLTSRWKAPILTDSFALYYFGKLQRMLSKNKISDNPNIHNDLLCGSQDIISVEPIHRTLDLATIAGKDAALKKLFVENSSDTILKVFELGEHAEFYAMIQDYLDKFGDRCVGELKLETISYKEDPRMYLDFIKSFVQQGVTNDTTASSVDTDLRVRAEAEVRKAFRSKPWKMWRFNTLVRKTRFLVSNRENLRYERTRVFGLTREMFSQIGKEFEKAGVLDHYRDVYYLTMQEMFAFIEGCSVDTNLKALVSMRKAEYVEYHKNEPPAERFTTYDAVNYGNDFYDNSILEDLDGELNGIGCCPGIVKARVQVIHSPAESEGLNGDILVTSSTDPGWVTLFPTTSAIIVERGSLLSHSAIVSREMGIPCIVGVTGLLKTLKTGDVVEMNGSTGEIKIIDVE
jgi:pyruvate,water dikinase